MNDYTMADLAVPKDDVSGEGCTFKNYSQPNDVTAYYTLICSGDQMLNVSRCVADTFENSAATSYMGSMWSVGGDPDMLPQLRLRNHAWEDPVSNASYRVYAIHTVSNADDPAWNVYPTDDGYAALTVPCHRRDEFADAEMVAMTKPTGSAWVTTWLKEEFGERSGFDKLLLIPTILGAVALIAGLASVGFAGEAELRARSRRNPCSPRANSSASLRSIELKTQLLDRRLQPTRPPHSARQP